MKHKLKLLPLLAALFTSALFMQCAKDDAGLDDAKQFGPALQSPYEYLEGAKKQKAIQALEKQFANAGRPAPQMRQVSATGRSGESWAVEFDEILLVTDSLGRKNFTYRVTHPRMSETIFYNLVHTEYQRGQYFYTSVKLVQYQMTDKFAGEYMSGTKDIAEFTGVIKFSPVAESREPILSVDPPLEPDPDDPVEQPQDPCIDDVVVVVPPPSPDNPNPGPVYIGGAGGGGSSGPGAEPDLSYYFGMADVHQSGRCWDWVKVPCSEGLHYGEAGCVAEHKGATYLLNYCSGTITSVYARDSNPVLIGDPCLPVGFVGVLGPMFETRYHKKNCEKLKKMCDTPGLSSKLQILKGKTEENKEYGYGIQKNFNNSYSNNVTTVQSDPDDPTVINAKHILGGHYIGAFHTHPDYFIGYYPMFSGADVNFLKDLADRHDNYGYAKNYSDYFITLTTRHGTYALKINDFDKLKNALSGGGFKDIKSEITYRYNLRQPGDDPELLMKDLLEILDLCDMGVSLFEAEESVDASGQPVYNWTGVSLNDDPLLPSQTLKYTPCN